MSPVFILEIEKRKEMVTVESLEFIVKLKNEDTPKTLPFKELFQNRSNMESMQLLWDCSSYYVNVEERYFIINGGRRVQPDNLVMMESPMVLYTRRNKQEVGMDGVEVGDRVITYLLGAEGIVDGIHKEILLEIEETGILWRWRKHR